MAVSPNAARPGRCGPPESHRDYDKFEPAALAFSALYQLASNLHGRTRGKETAIQTDRIKTMLDAETALLIASALSLALAVVFADLP